MDLTTWVLNIEDTHWVPTNPFYFVDEFYMYGLEIQAHIIFGIIPIKKLTEVETLFYKSFP